MNTRNKILLLGTCAFSTLAFSQVAMAEFFRMPLSMFVHVEGGAGDGDFGGDIGAGGGVNAGGLGGGSNSGVEVDGSANNKTVFLDLKPRGPIEFDYGVHIASYDFKNLLEYSGVSSLLAGVSFSVSGGNIPPGLSMTGSVLSGTTTEVGEYNFDLSVSHQNSDGDTQPYTIIINGVTVVVESISISVDHTCILARGGDVWCWGNPQSFGGSVNLVKNSPWKTSFTDIKQVSSGDGFTCYLSNAGAIACNGYSVHYQPSGAQVQGAVRIRTGGKHACAIINDGTVKCWGEGTDGQVGSGKTTSKNFPTQVVGLENVVDLALGVDHSCALISGGDVYCWGDNYYYQTGALNYRRSNNSPVLIGSYPGAVQIEAGQNHNCVLINDGAVKCWGHNYYKQLGGTPAVQGVPMDVPGLSEKIVKLGLGLYSSCGISDQKNLFCWGKVSDINSAVPVKMPHLQGKIDDIELSVSNICVIAERKMYCFGESGYGHVGGGTNINEPYIVDFE